MTDYLGPLTFGQSGTYALMKWAEADNDSATVELIVSAASADALATALEDLVAQLRLGNSYIRAETGVTNPVVYTVLGISNFALGSRTSWLLFWQRVSFTLNLAAQPAGAFVTLYNAQNVAAPASVDLSALLGTHSPMPDVTIDDQSGNNMHSVILALAPTALSDAKWLVMANALTWTTMSSGTGADMWGNSSRYTTSASAQIALLNTSQYPAGKHRLWVRVKQAAGIGYVKDSQNDTWVAVTRTTPHLLLIGDLDLPVADVAPGSAANLTLSVKSDGVNRLDVNAYLVIPQEYGYVEWHPDTATSEINQFDCGPSGVFVDGVCDDTYRKGGVLIPRILAAHVGTLIAVASPTDNNWPASWDKTAAGVSADTSRFKCVGASKYAWYAATNLATPLVLPGAWYELSFVRDVDFYVAGAATAEIIWQDVDGNTVRSDALSSVAANDAAPTAVTVYAKAPVHAARARVRLGTDATGNLTVYWSAVVLRRCPLRLIVVAEDAGGVLSNYTHLVHLTVKYRLTYEAAR